MGFEQKVLTEVTNARAAAVAAGAQGPAAQAAGRECPDRHPALAVRRRRELPRAQGERERPGPPGAADHDREPDLVLAAALQRDRPRLQHRHPDVPVGADRRAAGLHQARVLRRRARGRDGSERRPQSELPESPARHPEPWPEQPFYSQKAANKRQVVPAGCVRDRWSSRRSVSAIGYAITGAPAGAASVTAIALVLGVADRPRLLFQRRQAGPRVVRRETVDATSAAAADERRPGAGARGRHLPMPKVYIIDDTRARTRSRPAGTRSTRRSRSRPACSRSSTARSSRASSATSCRTSATSTSGSRCIVGVHGRDDRAPGRLLPAVHVLGRSGGRRSNRDSGGDGVAALIMVVAIVLAILAPIISRLVQLAVSRQREYLADASSVELTREPVRPRAGAGQDRDGPGGPRGRQPRRPSTCTSPTRSRSSRRARRG